jgi:hypothetical protein
MVIVVSADRDSAGSVELREPEDCQSFKVEVRGLALEGVAEVLQAHEIGRLDVDDAFIAPSAVKRLAAGRVTEDWSLRFDSMLDYARIKGWLDERGWIQAHCEWADA